MSALDKLNKFMLDPCVDNLLTKEEFDELTPFHKGFCHYIQAAWPESPLDETDPGVDQESDGYSEFINGNNAGMIWAQDTEE